ncbi:pyridoxamine 5'-phosphate oxidase family protein [Rhodococcus sp. NPDC056960]|uniref:pyridoxamine 5'-phosphate oxidase family protein n=1 Tax=Rhodococcus sp. NPDC056960 TaxID=3345982 RepID=UPI00362A4F77
MLSADRTALGEPKADTPPTGIRGEQFLQDEWGTGFRAERFYAHQMCAVLNPTMIEFIGRMELLFVGTAAADGTCDVSLRAGPPGFIHVFSADRLGYPEYQGNGVMASLGNIVENPHIGMFMADFVTDLIGLHVNGMARIVTDDELRCTEPDLPIEGVSGRAARGWVVVKVEEAYIHCRKHLPQMVPVPRARDWGTDDQRRKGGDYFGVAAERRCHR